jgi:hypothetical protein
MSPRRSKPLLTEIPDSENGDILRLGLMSGSLVVGHPVEVHGKIRTIVKIDKREYVPTHSDTTSIYRILYLSYPLLIHCPNF